MLVKNLDRLQTYLKERQIHLRIPNRFWAEKIYANQVSFHKLTYDKTNNSILIKPFNFLVYEQKPEYHFLLKEENVRLAQTLKKSYDCSFETNENQELVVNIEGIKALIKSEQDLEIINEIFLQGVYNFICDQTLVVIDIGMNVGWASLYFALNDNVQQIYSFEPFRKTYEEALNNFALNPNLKQKINPFDYGIGGKDEVVTVEYDYDLKASVGVQGVPENMAKKSQGNKIKEDITIKSATDVLSPIFEKFSDHDFMAKIDCEGSEYDILKSLEQANMLNRFKVIIMEWHEKGPDELVGYLRRANFTVFSRRPKSKNIGMIYAVRN
ncbi:MAG: FkbM family methyltransferase [Cyanobacterium sp.]